MRSMRSSLFVLVFTIGSFSMASISDFDIGVAVNNQNISTLAATSWEYAKSSTTQQKYGDGFAKSFYMVESTSELFSLSESNVIYLTDFESRAINGVWPLSRWSYLVPPFEMVNALELGLNYTYRGDVFQRSNDWGVNFPSCMRKTPLRYGDVEADGEPELYLSLISEHIILSPKYGGIIFAFMPFADDWVNYSLDEEYISELGGSEYQFISSVAMSNGSVLKAYRSYTKLYQGDFDEDGNSDLITWQKIFESNKVGDQDGFSFIRQSFIHYERDLEAQENSESGTTGEYLPQDTDEATIQSWLSDNELTWSKGYPSVSECEGEEGELIPEMHDPLLNDPDVLQ